MACVNPFDIFKVPTESLSRDVFRNASWRSIWLNLVPRGTYKNNTGLTQSVFTVANSHRTSDDEVWAPVALTNGSTLGACAATYNDTHVGYKEITYVPEQYALKGPTFCKDELIFNFNPQTFLPAYVQELSKRAIESWEARIESIYMQYATKVVITGTAATAYTKTITPGIFWSNGVTVGGLSATPIAIGAASAMLNQDHLDNIALELMYIGATNPDSSGFISLGEDGPIFSLLIGPEASKKIMQEDTVSGVRTDLRYLQSSELMKRMGATRVIRNFRHIINLTPPRFGLGAAVPLVNSTGGPVVTTTTANGFAGLAPGMLVTGGGLSGTIKIVSIESTTSMTLDTNSGLTNQTVTFGTVGAYTRINTYTETSLAGVGKGYDNQISQGWRNAVYEAAIVLSPHVFTSEIVMPVNSMGSLTWNPTNTLGEWMWVTGGQKMAIDCVDPLEKLGAHYAEFKHAPRPEFPGHGIVIIFKRT